MTTTTYPPREHLLHGVPAKVMGDIALLRAHDALLGMSEPEPHPERPGEIVVKVLADPRIAVPISAPSAAVALRERPTPARAVPLRHPAARPGWSARRKLTVAGGAVLAASALLGWLVSQLLALDLQQMAATALGAAAVLALIAGMVRKATGHSPVCVGLHCSGCSGH
ncbi:hypothetical protein [Micromonospora sp. NPDC047730]|uniref:hypothetical protein n=1 Tax=Micromonospora sp. NPDC047730 TaxID=3364253 RepID=UPI0037129AF7